MQQKQSERTPLALATSQSFASTGSASAPDAGALVSTGGDGATASSSSPQPPSARHVSSLRLS